LYYCSCFFLFRISGPPSRDPPPGGTLPFPTGLAAGLLFCAGLKLSKSCATGPTLPRPTVPPRCGLQKYN